MLDLLLQRLGESARVWQQLSSSQRIAIVLFGGIAIAASVFFLSWVSTPSYGTAFKGLSEENAAAVVAKLRELKVPYRLGEGDGAILVPSSMVYEVRLQLIKEGIPQKGGVGFEIFNVMNIGATEQMQKINYRRALEGELGRTIDRLEAVKQSRVHIAIPEPTLYTDKQEKITASIVLELRPGKRLDNKQIKGIANLVAGSVPGLKPENMTIVDTAGNILSSNIDDPNANISQMASTQLETKRNFEELAAKKLRSVLGQVLGQDKVAVEVSAVFDWDQVKSETQSYQPPQGGNAVRSSHELTEKTLESTSSQGGVPGTSSNAPANQQIVPSISTPTHERKDVTVNYELSKTVENVTKAPGTLKRISVGVVISSDSVSAEQANMVSDLVSAAVGLDKGRGDSVTVAAMPFPKATFEEDKKAMDEAQQQEFYVALAKIGGLVVSPLLLLLFLRLMLRRSARRAMTPALQRRGQIVAERIVPERKLMEEDPQKKMIRDEVSSLAKSEPALVSQLIHTWLEEDKK